jgi:hypothetical protein
MLGMLPMLGRLPMLGMFPMLTAALLDLEAAYPASSLHYTTPTFPFSGQKIALFTVAICAQLPCYYCNSYVSSIILQELVEKINSPCTYKQT